MNLQQRTALVITVNSMLTFALSIAVAVGFWAIGNRLDELEKAPTYHCDGSATMGYAVPGTPEAAACWIEGGEK